MKPKKPLSFADELRHEHFRVTIFGSARIKMNDAIYKEIFNLAKMIAHEGIDIVTGGGPGLMEAANAGHQAGRRNGDTHSVGLNIRLSKEQMFNKHLDIRQEFHRFSKRLDTFMSLSDAVVVAPGGVGTLLEFVYAWQLTQVKHICSIPIILLGGMWPDLLKWVEKWPLKKKLLDRADLSPLFLAKTPNEALKVIRATYEQYKKGDGDFCLNQKKYRIL